MKNKNKQNKFKKRKRQVKQANKEDKDFMMLRRPKRRRKNKPMLKKYKMDNQKPKRKSTLLNATSNLKITTKDSSFLKKKNLRFSTRS